MVPGTRKLAAVARKALTRGAKPAGAPAEAEPDPVVRPAAKKVAAKKAPAKKAPVAKKTPAKKAPAVKKTPAKKAPAKKTPAKKAPVAKKVAAPALAVKDGEDAWTAAELRDVVDELHRQQTHSLEIVEAQEAELNGLLRDSGDGAGQDQADVGASSFERDHELSVVSNERDKLAQIERALARIDDGSYGRCESCGDPIGKMRVMAFPRATLCMSCKQREERR